MGNNQMCIGVNNVPTWCVIARMARRIAIKDSQPGSVQPQNRLSLPSTPLKGSFNYIYVCYMFSRDILI